MSWFGWLVVLAGLYLLVVLVRGLIQLVSWLIDEFIIAPKETRQRPPKRDRELRTH